jgi:hypothetical protein
VCRSLLPLNQANGYNSHNPIKMKKYSGWSIMALLLFSAVLTAQTLTITAGSAEVASSGVKNHLYPIEDLYFQYNRNSEIFEARLIETRASVYRANISTVTISGLSTAAQKLAWLENTHLRANTAQFNNLVPRTGIAVRYNVSGKATSLFARYTKDQTPLWTGNADSIKTGVADTTTALRLTALRRIVRGATPILIGNNSNAATIAAGAAAGTGATVSITGNQLNGELTVNTGSSTTTTGVLATVTLPVACPTKCIVKLQPSSSFGSTQDQKVFTTTTAGTFVLNVNGTALTASTNDGKWFYEVTCN